MTDDLDLFHDFLRITQKRIGDREMFTALVNKATSSQDSQVDLMNRLLTIIQDIPLKIFPDDGVRLKIVEDIRIIIQDLTLQAELNDLEIVETKTTASFDDILDMFDF